MENTGVANAIPREVASQLCEQIRQENRGKWYTFSGLWCLGCETFTKGDPTKLCWACSPDCRGCTQVNARYDQQRGDQRRSGQGAG